MIHLFFETHATSLDNAAGIASGWNDVDLSSVGEQQARELGPRNQARGVSAVFCSDLRRSYRTAEIAFAGSGISIARDARLRECDYGDWNGRPTTEVETARQRHVMTPFPNGESYEQVVQRVRESIEAIKHIVNGPALIVGHRATFFALEVLLRGIPLADVVGAPWKWQPGWPFELPISGIRGSRTQV